MVERLDERKARGARSRQAILQAALATLSAKGLEGFTARNVAQQAGVSTATLFHHFASLDELQLDAIMQLMDDVIVEPLKRRPRSLRGYLNKLGELALDMIREQPELVRMTSVLFAKVPYSEKLRQRTAEYYDGFVQRIDADLAALCGGRPKDRRRRNVALALVLLLDAMGLHWMVYQDIKRLEGLWHDSAELYAAHLVALGRKEG